MLTDAFDEIISDIELLFGSVDWLQDDQQAVTERIRRAKIRYTFEDAMQAAVYGDAKQIINRLADQHHLDVKTIEKFVYPRPKSEES